jgi:hypothetical protein
LSFESRFAAAGRALDELLYSLRQRASRSRPSETAAALRESIAAGAARARDKSRAALSAQREHFLTGQNRSRFGVAALIVISIALTAVVTLRLAGGRSASVPPDAERFRSIAADRDARFTSQGAPAPIRSSTSPSVTPASRSRPAR